VGDLVVYGKSDRWKPLNVGVVQEVGEDSMKVLGHENTKAGEISCYSRDNGVNKRVVILPEICEGYFYEEDV
tara:strand:+ start:55338 stop:55553 length:216 start_codon:yes stop_codon:yes gene_type:complete